MRCDQIERFLIQISQDIRLGLGTPLTFMSKTYKTLWLISGEGDCTLNNDLELAVGQPNSR